MSQPTAPNPRSLTLLRIPHERHAENFLCKRYTWNAKHRRPDRIDVSAGVYFEFEKFAIESFQHFCETFRALVDQPHTCVIRGEPVRGTNPTNARRMLETFPEPEECGGRSWILVDFDEPELTRGEMGAWDARQMLPEPFRQAPCFWTRTGSYGVQAVGDDPKRDPWASKIRLGFLLDKPLTAPRLKKWLKGHHCDLSIYTPNHIVYTAAPLFEDSCTDPVIDAGESRFGVLDDGCLLDEVVVPDAIVAWDPASEMQGKAIKQRKILSGDTEKKLMEDLNTIDAVVGERHDTVERWAMDAYGCGMDDADIKKNACACLIRLGRQPSVAVKEAAGFVVAAQKKLSMGTLNISGRYLTAADEFSPVDDQSGPFDQNGAPLTPAQAQVQQVALVNWWDRYKRSNTGSVKPTLDNTAILLANHEEFQCPNSTVKQPIVAYDSFLDRVVWTSPPPWWQHLPVAAQPKIGMMGVPVTDHDYRALVVWWGQRDPTTGPDNEPAHIAVATAADALAYVARQRSVNTAQAWLAKCADEWDRKPRLDTFLERHIPHMKTATKLTREWFPKWIMQGVARILEPGAKADGVLVLQGAQGLRKSTFFESLLPCRDWFKDDLRDITNKDSAIEIRGKLIVELAEMASTRKDTEASKAFITRRSDSYRPAYGREEVNTLRTCIFGASLNDDDALMDGDGRRWWIVGCADEGELRRNPESSRFDLAAIQAERTQLWGEAYHRFFVQRERYYLTGELEIETRENAATYSKGAEFASDFLHWLKLRAEDGGPSHPEIFHAKEVWVKMLGNPASTFERGGGAAVKRIIVGCPTSNFYHKSFAIKGLGAQRYWVKRDSEMELHTDRRNSWLMRNKGQDSDLT